MDAVIAFALGALLSVSGLIFFRRKPQEVDLSGEMKLYKSFLEHTSDGMVILDGDYKILDVNPSFLRMFDYSEHELLGNPLYQYILASEYQESDDASALIRLDHDEYETVRTRKNGMPMVVKIRTFSLEVPTEDGMKQCLCSQYTDVTEHREHERKIQELAYYDTLTSLPNRYLLEMRVSEMMLEKTGFSMIYMDLNGFKHINDTLGHDFGDKLLVAFSRRVRGNIKKDDFLARLGGDEFVLLLPWTPRDHASSVIKRIHELQGNPFLIEGQRVYVGLAAGITAYPDDGVSVKELFRFADIAMYTAKQESRPYLYYDAKMHESYQQRMELEQQLIPALKKEGEIVLHYLPVYDVKRQRFVSLEALCRWNHPRKGLLNSSEFIHIAEDSKLIFELGALVLRTAFRQAEDWRQQGLGLSVTVNLSAKEVLFSETVELLQELKTQYPESAGLIELEITEAVTILNETRGREIVHGIKQMGFKIILDDFGVGYSSLSLLRDLHIDRLKIDKYLIDDAQQTNSTALILKGLLHIAGLLDVDVVAEGISTPEQRELLEQIGFRYLQGFYFSRPLPAEDVPSLVEKKHSYTEIGS
jgi:diguanylate cyclase (GGDEF)-like protein/PAS domain S-box-containing protein